MRKFTMIIIFLLGIGSLGVTQNTNKYAVAVKGEGIWTLLRRNGLDPAKNIAEFIKINKTILSENGDLVVGTKYLLPGANVTKNSTISNQNSQNKELSIEQLNTNTATKSTIAKKGEGIWTLLKRNGLDPSKNIAEFRKINKTILGKNGELVVGTKYLLPGTNVTKNPTVSNQNSQNKEISTKQLNTNTSSKLASQSQEQVKNIVTTPKSTIAKKGEGIWTLLKRNGLDPSKDIAEFRKINKTILGENGELVVGTKYLLPGANVTIAPSITNQNSQNNDLSPQQLNTNITPKSTIAEKGEGIWTLLKRNGLNPSKNIAEFRKINKDRLKNGRKLIVGVKYLLPASLEADNLSIMKFGEGNSIASSTVENRQIIEFKYNPAYDSLDVVPVEKGIKELGSGASSNMVIMLINQTETAKNFKLKVSVPEAWSSLTNYTSQMVAKRSKKIKVLSFYIPELTQSGADTIRVQVLNQADNSEIASLKLPVFIKPKYDLIIEKLPTREHVFAGDSMMVNFRVKNLSNVEVDVKTTVVNQKFETQKTFTLKQYDYENIRVPILTNDQIILQTRKSVNLTATIIQMPDISVSESYAYDVIPTKTIKFDAHNRFPIQIGINAVSGPQYRKSVDQATNESIDQATTQYGYMFDISGKGMISTKKKSMLEFHLRKPDTEGNPLFGQNSEYYGSYTSKRLAFIVGDNNFRLSDLTESSRFGRGVMLENTYDKIMFGAFVNYPKYYPEVKKVYAAYTSYFPTKNFEINIGYLNKTLVSDTTVGLFTVSSTANLFKRANLAIEYAAGMKNKEFSSALKANLQINGSRLRSYVNYTISDKNFPGYFSNSKYLSIGASSSVLPNLNISTSYEVNHMNASLDTIYANSPLSSNLNLSANIRIKKYHSLGMAFFMRKREDRMESKLFHYEDKTIRITGQSRWKKIQVNAYGEIGNINNLLLTQEGELTKIYKTYFSLNYTIDKNFTIKAFTNYNGGQYYESNSSNSIFYGASLDAFLWRKLNMMIEYQNNYEMEEYHKDRSLLSSRINYSVNNKHEVALSANYNLTRNTLNNKEIYLSFSYRHLLNLPISKKKDIGSLKGRLINKGVQSVEGVTFFLSGIAKKTDKDGYFEFPMIKAGTHMLLMDDSNTGLNTITERPGPYYVEIIPGQVNEFEIAITKSASIIGKIIIQEDSNKGSKGYVPIKENIGSLILEISKGDEIFRVYSSKDGLFNFGDLRVGKWNVKVYENGIPEGYEIITSQFQTELTSGEVKVIEVLIKKKSRKIKFQRKIK